MKLSEKAAYIKGLIEGMELDPKDKQTKIWKLMSELMGEMAEEIGELEQCYDDLSDQIDGIGEDLAGVEDLVYDESFEGLNYSKLGYGESDAEMSYEVTCPTCGMVIALSEDSLAGGSIKCPQCSEVLEFDFDEDELDNENEDESAK